MPPFGTSDMTTLTAALESIQMLAPIQGLMSNIEQAVIENHAVLKILFSKCKTPWKDFNEFKNWNVVNSESLGESSWRGSVKTPSMRNMLSQPTVNLASYSNALIMWKTDLLRAMGKGAEALADYWVLQFDDCTHGLGTRLMYDLCGNGANTLDATGAAVGIKPLNTLRSILEEYDQGAGAAPGSVLTNLHGLARSAASGWYTNSVNVADTTKISMEDVRIILAKCTHNNGSPDLCISSFETWNGIRKALALEKGGLVVNNKDWETLYNIGENFTIGGCTFIYDHHLTSTAYGGKLATAYPVAQFLNTKSFKFFVDVDFYVDTKVEQMDPTYVAQWLWWMGQICCVNGKDNGVIY